MRTSKTVFEKVSPARSFIRHGYKVALRATRGPTNSCIDFHCDGPYATSTSQIPLNSPTEYKGGQLCFFVNDELHFVPRPRGSLVQHARDVLHGVTQVTEGMRKSLFIVDITNGAGDPGVVVVRKEDVAYFLAHRSLVAWSDEESDSESDEDFDGESDADEDSDEDDDNDQNDDSNDQNGDHIGIGIHNDDGRKRSHHSMSK